MENYNACWKSDASKDARQKIIEKNKTQNYSKVSASQKALYQTEEGKEILRQRSQKVIGTKRSEETKRKMSLAQKGRIISPEHRLKISKRMEELMNKGLRALPFSKSELEWGNFVQQLFKINLQHSFWLDGYCFDYKYQNYLFELDGSYWYTLPNTIKKDKLKEQLAKEKNFILLRFTIDTPLQAKESITQNFNLLQSIFKTDLK
ncbi:MAG: NUMOD3 domain-containing DNA-binding protein [Methanogenium sp.]